ncbi:MAG: RNA repair transcriptional activator RtcR family protein [Planctomycetota bacterium]
MRVLLEWIAWGADPDDPAELGEGENRGPTLQLLEDDTYGRKIGRAYIFADRYSIAKAEATAGFLSRTEGYPETEAQQLALDDSTDYAQLYNAMSRAVGRIRRSLADTKDVEFLVNVSPGYPQAQTIWFILVNSDKLDATLLQTIEPNKARELGIRQVREVRLDLEPYRRGNWL